MTSESSGMGLSRYFLRTWILCSLLVVFCVLGFSVAVIRHSLARAESQASRELNSQLNWGVNLAAEALNSSSDEAANSDSTDQNTLQKWAQSFDLSFALYDIQGALQGHSIDETSAFSHLPKQLSVRSDQPDDQLKALTNLPAPPRSRVVVKRILNPEGSPIGLLRVVRSEADLQNYRWQISLAAWTITILGLLIALLLAWLLTRSITRARAAIAVICDVTGHGEIIHHLDQSGTGDFEDLITSLRQMNVQNANRIEALRQESQTQEDYSNRLSTVLAGMVEGVIAVNTTERILFANDAAMDLLDITSSQQQVIGRPFWELIRNLDVRKMVQEVLSRVDQATREMELPRSNKRIAFLASRLPGDPCPGVVLVLHNVTELRRLERIRSEFVSNVGHELKTPLAAIQACTETMLDGAIEEPEHARRFLSQISEHADRLHKLIIDLMELAKIESEEDVFDLQIIDIGIPIQESIDEHQPVAKARQVRLEYEPTIEELLVKADPDGIRTLVSNLLDNALNYTPASGKVRVSWKSDGQDVIITVADSGIGIDPGHQERIFERFYRVDSARSRDAGGTGLGLSIVKHLCQYFGGTIELQSQPGKGTTFTVRLPLVTAEINELEQYRPL
ncbi:MAG: PAS domain-containing protein [Planctomycetaceae bacterium]|nr:PAS domain-containing protein [Planctomycetaceae bacterium]